MGTRTGTPIIREVNRLTVTVITDNYYDALRQDTSPAKRHGTKLGASIRAEHGLSYLVEMVTAGKEYRLMFDYGVDGQDVLHNMKVLDIELATIDALALSHGHLDHWGGLLGILKRNREAMPKDTPLYVGEEAFAHRYAQRPSGVIDDIGRLDRRKIEATGAVRIVEVHGPTEIVRGAYLSGPVERITNYEQVPPFFLVKRGGRLQHDLFTGEQGLAFVVKGKGLVVLSGCSHCGIVNTIRYAQKMTGVSRLHAILGGFHLVNATPERIGATLSDIKAMAPDWIVPTHCTGFEALSRFSDEMAGAFILNTAGTKYVFGE
jgi:7,8-dihydropterin-6-yl-methyl-4-(beta-D-ribofuranosyl)aminobenzene 5'-phosphate synthase